MTTGLDTDRRRAIATLNARAQSWLRSRALPLWSSAGVDPDTGGFLEALTLDGAPVLNGRRRMRVQARQIYVYADAAQRYGDTRACDIARRAFAWMSRVYWSPEGGWVFAADRDGAVVDESRDSYEQAFAIFAAAWLLRVAPDSDAKTWIDRSWDFLDQQLASPHGGFRESLPDKAPRRQNPHMHLLEACLACHESTGEDIYLERARTIYDLFRRFWFDPDRAILGEYFSNDWQPVEDQRFEPGHHMEWTWLLQRLTDRTGVLTDEAVALHGTAERRGRARDGLLIDECAADGGVTLSTKRCWPQTEEIKGQVAMYERTDDVSYLDRAAAAVERLLGFYLLPNGAWQDQIDADGNGVAENVPASTFYHIALALNEFDRMCGTIALTEPTHAPPRNQT